MPLDPEQAEGTAIFRQRMKERGAPLEHSCLVLKDLGVVGNSAKPVDPEHHAGLDIDRMAVRAYLVKFQFPGQPVYIHFAKKQVSRQGNR